MKSSTMKRARVAVMLFLAVTLTSASWAAGYKGGVPWQVGDVIICFGSGTCNVVRINGATVTLLDQFSDGLSGETRGVAINNTLHAVVTDNGSGSDSNVVVYTIASVDPTTSPSTPIAHTPVAAPFNGSGGTNSGNAQAVVVNGAGHIFVGNAGSGAPAPSIVELNPGGSVANTFLVPSNCIDAGGQFTSMDLSSDGNTIYFTSGGTTVQKLTLSPSPAFSCSTSTPVANFATSGSTPATPAVTLFDIAVVPAGSLSGTCNGNPCPTTDALLVVAKGLTSSDNDADSSGEPNGLPDPGPGIMEATESGTTATITTSAAHGFNAGDTVQVQGVGVSGYNGTFTVLVSPAPTATKFAYTASASGLGDSGGGTANDLTTGAGDDLLVDVCTGATPTGTQSSCALLVDRTTGAILTRYQTSQTTLQALALDPLVRDCSGGTCLTSSPTVKNFWLGDSQSANFYKVDFATGTPSAAFNANADCSSHPDCNATFASVHGLRIFGAQGANQADLTKLFSGALTLSSGNNPPVYAQAVSFPPGASSFDLNTMNAGVYGLIAETPPKATFYASLASQAGPPSNGNNSGATDGGVSCQPTVPSAAGSCIVWKLDVLTNAGNPLPLTSYVSTNFGAPAGTTDFGTHVFLDEHYDVTTFLGNLDPGGGGRISVWSLQEVPADFSTSGTPSGCAFSSPVNNTCYKTNRTTLPFTVPKCSGLSQTQFQSLPQTLLLSLVGVGSGTPKPPPNIIKLTATNTKGPFRYDSLKNQLQFNWTVNGNATAVPGTYRGCALDSPGTKGFTIEGFCVNFTLSNSCK